MSALDNVLIHSGNELGTVIGTRPLGQRVREQLMPLLEQN